MVLKNTTRLFFNVPLRYEDFAGDWLPTVGVCMALRLLSREGLSTPAAT